MIKVAIVEIGGSHDECILTQVMALKNVGCYCVFCGTKQMFERNSLFEKWFDEFHEVVLPHTMFGDLFCMKKLNAWFKETKITKVILNTAQGGHMRNLCLTSHKSVKFFGVLHTIKLLQGSFTQNVISRKVKNYFVLNDQLKLNLGPKKGLMIRSFYPLDYPPFELKIEKPTKEIRMAIIGGVENRRKDLTGFIEFAKETSNDVHFVFLGKSDAFHPDVIEFKRQLKLAKIENRITLFDDFIPQELFDAYLKSTDGIMPLVHPMTASADEYFSRQISGAINVAFSYGIPMMIHEEYRFWEDFSTGVQFYTPSTIQAQFEDFCSRLIEYKKALIENTKFSKVLQQHLFAEAVLNRKLWDKF